MLGNKPNQPTKFRTKNWVKINDESRGSYNKFNQNSLKMLMLRSSLCDYNDTYILAKATIAVAKERYAALNDANKKEIFITCMPFTSCMSIIN